MRTIPVLWLCGPPGVGKTTVAWEVRRRLHRAGAAPAYVDVDQLGICFPEPVDDPGRHRLKATNVGALRRRFAAAGAGCLVVSGVVDAQRGPERDLLGGGEVVVHRLRAAAPVLAARLDRRVGATAQPDDAVREAAVLDGTTFADECIETTDRSLDDVADEVVARFATRRRPVEEPPPPPPGAEDAGRPRAGRILWCAGPTGVGKSTVGFRAYLAVLASGVPAAYVDVAQLSFVDTADDVHVVRARNLAAVRAGFSAAGVDRLVVVGAVGGPSERDVYERMSPGDSFTWCRLHADRPELRRRITTRRDGGGWPEPGDPLLGVADDELRRVADHAVLEADALERDGTFLRIDVSGLTAEQAALALLARAGWVPE